MVFFLLFMFLVVPNKTLFKYEFSHFPLVKLLNCINTLVRKQMENKYNKVKCYSFLLLDLYASITPQLTGYKIHQGSATAIWQGAG